MGNTPSALTTDEIEDLTSWSTFTPKEIEAIFDRFNELDNKSNGYLTFTELMRIPEFHSNPLSSLIVRQIERITDYDNISFPHFLEFLEIFSVRKDSKQRTLFLFKVFDINNENRLCEHVLRKIAFMIGSDDFYNILRAYDMENKGYLNIKDFTRFYLNENIEKTMAIDFSKDLPEKKVLNFREFFRLIFG